MLVLFLGLILGSFFGSLLRLRSLVGLKSAAHYGDSILTTTDRTAALRHTTALTEDAKRRTT